MLRLEVSQDVHRIARKNWVARQLGLPIPVRVGSLSFDSLFGQSQLDGARSCESLNYTHCASAFFLEY